MAGQKMPEEERRRAILKAAFAVAARSRLTGLTIQQVGEEAGISKGLVFFYYASKDALLVALLEWLLATTIIAQISEDVLRLPTAQKRFLTVLHRDIEQLPAQSQRVELFFDYWVMGTRHPEIRAMIRAALDRYREAYRPLAREVVEAEPDRYYGITAEALSAVATSFVTGCALQAVMHPEDFDVAGYIETLNALIAQPERVSA